jgi:hypothetical protein
MVLYLPDPYSDPDRGAPGQQSDQDHRVPYCYLIPTRIRISWHHVSNRIRIMVCSYLILTRIQITGHVVNTGIRITGYLIRTRVAPSHQVGSGSWFCTYLIPTRIRIKGHLVNTRVRITGYMVGTLRDTAPSQHGFVPLILTRIRIKGAPGQQSDPDHGFVHT